MKYTYLLSGVAAFALLFSGCEKNEDPPQDTGYSQGIYIVNEGSFQSNNGSISYYDPREGLIINGVFEAANGRALGDVVQSFATVGDTTGFIVVNGSAKLEIIDLRTFKSITAPIPVDYPRYFLKASEGRGYLTGGSMQGYVYLINLRTLEMEDSIKVGFGPETMALLNEKVYIANSGGWSADSTIYVINTLHDELVDTINVGFIPVDLVFDGTDKLWVYCKGLTTYSWDPPYELISETESLIQQIDINQGTIIWTGVVGLAGDYTATPPRIAASADGESIYYLRPDGVYKMDAVNPAVPDTPIITGNFYGLDVNPDDGNIYLFEASFTGNGTMKIFNESGTLLSEGTVGIAPNGAVFH
jgi:hypothetical protein